VNRSVIHPSAARGRAVLAIGALAVLALVVVAGSAVADFRYAAPVAFNAGGSAEGDQLPVGAAVDNSASAVAGSVYIANGTVVNRYSAASAAAGSNTPDSQLAGFTHAWGVAVDPANGDVYVTDNAVANGIRKFDAEGNSLPFTLDPALPEVLGSPSGIAVHPSNGHVFVASRSNNYMFEFTSSGVYTGNSYSAPVPPQGLAVDSSGALYVADGEWGALKFTATGETYETLTPEFTNAIAVDPADQHVFTTGTTGAREFDATGTQVGPAFGTGELTDSYGIAVPSGGARLYATDNPTNVAYEFTRLVMPNANTEAATAIGGSTATLNGTVDPDGGPDATCSFSYGTDPELADAETVACTPAGPFANATAVSATLSDLSTVATYYFRVESSNSNGATNGEIMSFTTSTSAPVVETGMVSDYAETTATLTGAVNPAGLSTTYRFEYGATASYGFSTPVSVAGVGNQALPVAAVIAGLQPSTTYHYRLVATNSLGTTHGADRTFATGGPLPVRAYEQVSPFDSDGVPLVPGSVEGFRARDDGNRAIFATYKQTYPGAGSSPMWPRNMSTRTENGWVTESLEKPVRTADFKVNLYRTVWATSDDMSRMAITSTRSLGGQGTDGAGNLYIYDANTGDYTLVVSGPQLLFEESAGSNGQFQWIGGSDDFRSVAFSSKAALTLDAPTANSPKIYIWTEGRGLRYVGEGVTVRPDGLSSDGRRLYFNIPSADTGTVGAFLDEEGVQIPISVSERAGDPPGPVAADVEAVSPDGRYAILMAIAPLTEDAAPERGLYRYDAVTDDLEFLAPSPVVEGGARPIMRAWPERSEMYFRAGMSLYHFADGESTLAVAGYHPQFASVLPEPSATPDGRYYAFESTERFTTYDNRGASEIYLYDAEAKEVLCASCRPDGRPPTGKATFGPEAWEKSYESRVSRAISDDGTVYFDTPDPLVAADTNGTRDVYAYRDGRPTLITPGNQAFDARFSEVTPSGRDVFFTTAQSLVARDLDGIAGLYDARVGGGIAAQNTLPPAACRGEACRGITTPAPPARQVGSQAMALSGKPASRAKRHCGKNKRLQKRNGKTRCVKRKQAKKTPAKHNRNQGR